MKVCLLVLNTFTNDHRVHKEATTLADAGYSITVIALWKPGLPLTDVKSGYRVQRVKLWSQRLKDRSISPLVKYIEFTCRVLQQARKDPAQVYQANDANTLPAAWLASRRNHAKLIYDAHELESGRNFAGSIAWFWRKIWILPEIIFIHKAHSVITVSPAIADEISRQYRIPKPYVVLNCPNKSSLPKSDRLRRELSIQPAMKILLYQGLVSKGRGIDSFMKAVQLLENVVGVVLGDGPDLNGYRQRVQTGEWKYAIFLGKIPLEELLLYTASADIGTVLTQDTCLNHKLSLPNKLFEYIQAGLPVICSNLPAMAQIVRQYNFGALVDPEDPVSIANSARHILENPALYEEMRTNALKAADIFNWDNESKKYLEIYNQLN